MRPLEEFHVEIEVLDPDENWFVIGLSVLDGPNVLAPSPLPSESEGTFVLDRSLLDGPDLLEGFGYAKPGYIWQEVTGISNDADIQRGIAERQGVTAHPQSGSMSLKIKDPAYDALANPYIGVGNKIRIRAGADFAFLGHVTRLATEYTFSGLPIMSIQASDAIARLNSITMEPRPAETYSDRINAATEAGKINRHISGSGLNLNATDQPMTALELVKSAQDSEASYVWVDRWNELHALERGEALGTPRFTFSNKREGHNVLITALQTSYDTDNVINHLTVNNMETVEGVLQTVQYTYADKTSASYYGVRKQSVTTALDPSELKAYSNFVFRQFATAQRKIKRLEFVTDEFNSPSIPDITHLDVGDTIAIDVEDLPHSAIPDYYSIERVATISHTINEQRWMTQISVV